MTGSRAILLLVASNPDGQAELRLDREARSIQQRLATAERGRAFEVVHRLAARAADLVDALNDVAPSLVHFAGHGDDQGILLEADGGGEREVGTDGLVRLFSTVREEVRCVVLAACSTEPHATALADVIDCVVGMRDSIDDEAAAVFSANFYRALASGRSVRRSFEQAIAMMVVEGVGDEDVPVLEGRQGVDLDAVRFDQPPADDGDRPARITLVLQTSLAELDASKLGLVVGELMKRSGDVRLEIGSRAPGSVRLAVHTTADGAARIASAFAAGTLETIRGIRVLAVEVSDALEMTDEIEATLARPSLNGGPELREVELPFLDQLASMGWRIITGSTEFPSVTGRASFREVLIRPDLRAALRRVNLRDGEEWLDDGRISQAVSALERIGHKKLIEANQEATALLVGGVQVEGIPGWDGGRARTIHFVDWEHPERNTFTAVSQFKVDCPGGMSKGSIRPDITLFVNGVPVVVVECKSPAISEPIAAAVDQLRRYQNARTQSGEVEDNEGNERLFYTNQFLIATSYDEARVGTIGAETRHYLEWKDTAPVAPDAVALELGKLTLSSQNRLVAGMLRPAHLLDIIRHFTIYQQVNGKTVKIVCRYQQFRAVQASIDRLLHGKTRAEDGEHDRRGGIVWHTQGSGKSLTMVFLVRKMRSIPELRRFKVVIVTDRKDLERQLAETATLTGETVEKATNVGAAKALLRRRGPGLVFAMIQKQRNRDLEALGPEDEVGDLGLLNDDPAIVLLVDEAHRSHTSKAHGYLMQALPNAAKIGFTGTPIIMGDKKRTHDIFGEFIDRYTLKESEADGATVPILYEGRTASGAVADGRDLDQLFEDLFDDADEKTLEAIKRKHATRAAILESEAMIAAKARDMLRHYVANILPNGLKAQVVSYSRLGAVRYQAALTQARDELVVDALAVDSETGALDDVALQAKPVKVRAAVRAARQLDLLRSLEFGTVISPDNNDPGEWAEWSDGGKIEARVARFKKPLPGSGAPGGDDSGDPLGFLVVKSMLLTGFDAPIEGVMYLDRPIREAELLQAIARVNRTCDRKQAGILVDYYGLAHHLKEALAAYSEEDIEGVLQSLKDEIPKLRDQHTRVLAVFKDRGVDPIADVEGAVELLASERLRAEFTVKLKQFLGTLDLVLPRPEGLPFVRDAAILGEIYQRARNRYREGLPPLGKDVGRKVQALIDQHVVSLGIDPRIPPIAITDAKFAEHVGRAVSSRAKASEMEHAARHHIRKKLEEDPVHYQKLSERLEEILKKFGEDWEQLALALKDFVEEVKKGRQNEDGEVPLDPVLHAPFFDILKQEREKETPVRGADAKWLAELSVQLVDQIVRDEIRLVGFWKNAPRQEELRGRIFMFLDEASVVPFERLDAVVDRVMELAKANHDKLVRGA